MGYIETPPILQGDAQEQIAALRDYLFRLANSLDSVGSAPAVIVDTGSKTTQSPSGQSAKTVRDLRENAAELKALITENAKAISAVDDKIVATNKNIDSKAEETTTNLISYVNDTASGLNDTINTTLQRYVAKSEFGEYQQNVTKSIAEEHSYSERILSDFQSYQTTINGQIVRGFVADPADPNGPPLFGIAISQNLSFDADVTYDDGKHIYYALTCDTFGLYTAQGWQFWLNGQRAGWFDSTKNGLLHVQKVVAEDFLQISGEWQIKIDHDKKELEFVYIGS